MVKLLSLVLFLGLFSFTESSFALTPAQTASCNQSQILLTNAAGNTTSYTNLQTAVTLAGSGSTISVGNVSSISSVSITLKSNLTITTNCDAKVANFDIFSSQNITIHGFKTGNGIVNLASGVKVSGIIPVSSNITIEDCEITNSWANGIQVDNNQTGIVLKNNYIHDNGGAGVQLGTDNTGTIQNNSIVSNNGDGINSGRSSNLTIDRNQINGNGDYGIQITGAQNYGAGIVISNNTVVQNDGNVNSTSSRDIASFNQIIGSNDTGNKTTNGTEGNGTQALVDTAAPLVAFNVLDNARFNTNQLLVTFSITDASTTTSVVSLNNTQVKTTALLNFSEAVTLVNGANTIKVVSTDLYNHTTTLIKTVYYDTTAPSLATIVPANGSSVSAGTGTITVSGSANEDLSLVTINSTTIPILTDKKQFSGTVNFGSTNGSKTMSIKLTDLAGNQTTASSQFTLTIDPDAPVITLNNTVPTSTTSTSQSLNVTIQDASNVTNTIFVNGNQVFQNSVKSFTTTVTLAQGNNQIRIDSVDQYGHTSSISRNIFLDSVAPVLSSISPQSGTTVVSTTGSVTIIGHANESLSSATANGSALSLQADTRDFQGTISFGLNPGPKSIAIQIKDILGNATNATLSITLVIDQDAPVITLNSPFTTPTNVPALPVNVTVTDASNVTTTVSLNGAVAYTQTAKTFETTLQMSQGQNVIRIESVDQYNNSAAVVKNVFLDSVAPTVSSLSPQEGDTVFSPNGSVTVEGIAGEALQEAKINGELASLQADQKHFSKTIAYGTASGAKTVTLLLKDLYGNTTTVSRHFTLVTDQDAPVIAITNEPPALTKYSTYVLNVTITDAASFASSVYLNNVKVVDSASGTISTSLTLVEGSNVIRIDAQDSYGNASTVSRTVVLDTILPQLAQSSPQANENVYSVNGIVQVSGSSNESLSFAKVNGADLTIGTDDKTFSGSVTLDPASGSKSLSIQLTDKAGNTTVQVVTFKLETDQSAPVINIVDAVPAVTHYSSFNLNLSIADDSATTTKVFLNDVKVFESSAKVFTAPLQLAVGSNSIRVESVDSGSYAATPIVKTTNFAPLAPILTIQPASGSTVITDASHIVDVSISSDKFLQSASVDGVPVGSGTVFAAKIPYSSAGSHSFQVSGADLYGNTTTQNILITIEEDLTAPTLAVAIEDGLITNNPQLVLPVNVTDDHGITTKAFVNGALAATTNDKLSNLIVSLSEGQNKILVTAVDEAGNSSPTVKFDRIFLDTAAPKLSISSPLEGQQVDRGLISVSGLANEGLSSIKVNSQVIAINAADSSFSGTVNLGSLQGEQVLHFEAKDLANNIGTIDVPIYVKAFVRKNLALVSNKSAGKLSVINSDTHILDREIAIVSVDPEDENPDKGSPANVIATVQSDKVFVILPSLGQLSAIDLKDGNVIDTTDLPLAESGNDTVVPRRPFAIDPSGFKVYIARARVDAIEADPADPEDVDTPAQDGGLTVYDNQEDTFAKIDLAGISPDSLAITSEGSKIYISTGASTVSVFDTATNSITETVNVPVSGLTTKGVFLSPDNQKLFVTGTGTGISIINTQTKNLIQTVQVSGSSSEIVNVLFSADSSKAYVLSRSASSGTLSVLNTTTLQFTSNLSLPFHPFDSAIKPGSQELWVTSDLNSTVKIVNLDSLTISESIAATSPTGIAFGFDEEASTANLPPLASFTATPGTVLAGDTVSFDATSSKDDVGIQSYSWVFSDGFLANTIKVNRAFQSPGEYTAALTVTDGSGESRTKIRTVQVVDKNAPPLASFTSKRITDFGILRVDFDASASIKLGGRIASYEWSFGDNSIGTGSSISHTYQDAGQYMVELKVTDEYGFTGDIAKIITVQDTTPLNILVSTPRGGTFLNVNQVQVVGQTDERASLVKINGTQVNLAMDGKSFEQVVTLPNQGRNIIVIEARDQSGNLAVLNLPVTVDTVGPILSEITPASGSTVYTQTPEIHLGFKTNEVLGALSINGHSQSASPTNVYSLQIPANADAFGVSILAADRANNVSSSNLNYNVVVDNTAPAITLGATDGEMTNTATFSFLVNIDDQSPITTAVKLNGQAITTSALNSFNVSANLASGENSFTITTTDAAGNLSNKVLSSITLDTVAPVITLGVEDGQRTNQPSFTIPVSLADLHGTAAAVYVNGALIDSSTESSFDAVASLNEGENTVMVTAQDSAGNSAVTQYASITLDTVAPELSNIKPEEGSSFVVANYFIFTNAESNEPLKSLRVNGKELSLNLAQMFFLGDMEVIEGSNTFNFVATDLAGNISEFAVNFNVEVPTGYVHIMSDLSGNQILSNDQFSFGISVDSLYPTTTVVRQNGVTVFESSDSYMQVNVTLNEGVNYFEVTTTDVNGVSDGIYADFIELDTTPPVIDMQQPFAGQTLELGLYQERLQVYGESNEPLQSVTFDGMEIGDYFGSSIDRNVEFNSSNSGAFLSELVATDMAGNQTRVPIPFLIVRGDVFTGTFVQSIFAGGLHSCVAVQGTVQCWGKNTNGQLGTGNNNDSPYPRTVSGLSDIQNVSTKGLHSCSLDAYGAVKCWGSNAYGQLGNGLGGDGSDDFDSNVPVDVVGLDSGVTKIAVGTFSTCAIQNGALKCWGGNFEGTLGIGMSGAPVLIPTQVVGLDENSGVTDVTLGGSGHTCAIVNGGAKCWGRNGSGQLGNGLGGDGTNDFDSNVPVDVVGLDSEVYSLSTGGFHTCAIQGSSTKCWGNNLLGQLGNGNHGPLTHSSVPVQVVGINVAGSEVSSGGQFTCTNHDNGAKCWGDNSSGQLGANITTGGLSDTPQSVITAANAGVYGITTGEKHACAFISQLVKCWGENGDGRLGDGTTVTRFAPTQVEGLNFGSSSMELRASFDIDPDVGRLPQPTYFNAFSSIDLSGAIIVSYSWDFGDGSTGTGVQTQHAYSTAGSYSVTLTVTNDQGRSASLSQFLVIQEPEAPVARYSYYMNTGAGLLNVNFDAGTSSINGGTITSYAWDFGDGQTSSAKSIVHQYQNSGSYTAQLTVMADNGMSATISKTFEVADRKGPVITFSSPVRNSTVGGTSLVFSGLSNEPLASLTLNDLPFELSPDRRIISKTYNLTAAGQNKFKFVATDDTGNVTVDEFIINVDNVRPFLTAFTPAHLGTLYTSNGTIAMNATSSKPLAYAKVNGQSMVLMGNGFVGSLFNQPAGNLTLSVLLADTVGNTSTTLIKLTHVRDNIAPVVTTTALNNFSTQESNYQFDINVTDSSPTTTEVKQNGVTILSSNLKAIPVSATLSNGVNNFAVVTTDQASNQTTVNITNIKLDNVGPLITVTSPTANGTISKATFTVAGTSNEVLQSVDVAGRALAITNGGLSFSGAVSAPATGVFNLNVHAVDLAGNESNVSVPVEFTLLLNPALVATEKGLDGKINVVGHPGAAKAGLTVNAKAGFFNSGSAIAAQDGSFLIPLSFFRTGTISVRDPNTSLEDSAEISYNVITRLAGIVKDTNGNPLPGVNVTVSGSSTVSTTDVAGTFHFDNPPTGDQQLSVDASPLTDDLREFHTIEIAVTIGVNQDNILENPIFLAPLLKDGTETLITDLGGAIVTSPNAPGVQLSIPNGIKATFPDGESSGNVNISIVSADKTTIPTVDFAKPTNVIYLEPSGLTFDNRVTLTIPNVNELPAGVELAILSMNNDGAWEVDGLAAVSPNGQSVVTKNGHGISHFSPKYAVPLGPVIRKYNELGAPGIDTFNGSLSAEVKLPSFKSLGQDFAPTLIYKSAWAKPTALVTNFFDIPQQRVEFEEVTVVEAKQRLLGKPKVTKNYCSSDSLTSTNCYEKYFDYWKSKENAVAGAGVQAAAWYQPESITAQFFVSGLTSEQFASSAVSDPKDINYNNMTWNSGVPNQALVSFGVDLKDPDSQDYFASGIYPSIAHYEIKLKNITLSTQKIFQLDENGKKVLSQSSKFETKVLDDIFPSDLLSQIYVQNETQSVAGRGWKIGGVNKIVNPSANRVVLEESDGSVSIYGADSKIETLFNSENTQVNLSRGVSLAAWPIAAVVREESGTTNLATLDLSQSNPTVSNNGALPKTSGVLKSADLCPKSGTKLSTPKVKFVERNHNYSVVRSVDGLYMGDAGEIFGTDSHEHSLFTQDGTQFRNILRKTVPVSHQSLYKVSNKNKLNSYCGSSLDSKCSDYTEIASRRCSSTAVISRLKLKYKYASDSRSNLFRSETNLNTGIDPVGSTETVNSPMGIVGGPDGYLYIADYGNHRVIKVNPDTGYEQVVAGNGTIGDSGDGSQATLASMYHPRGLAFDDLGNLYVATEHGYIRRVSPDGLISTFAGRPLGSVGSLLSDQVHASQLSMGLPTGLVFDKKSNSIFVSDSQLNRIIQINLATLQSNVVAGNGQSSCTTANYGDGNSALNACLSKPTWLGLDANKNLLIVDSGNNRIRRVVFASTAGVSLAFSPANLDGSLLNKKSNGSFERVRRNGVRENFDSLGRHLSTIDRVGRTYSYAYDSSGKLKSVTDPVGQKISYNYSGERLASIVDPANRVTQFVYSGNLLTRVDLPDGTSKKYGYSPDGLLNQETNQKNFTTSFEYNSLNRIAKVIRPDNSEITINDALADTAGNNYTAGNPGHLKSMSNHEVIDGIISARQTTTSFERDLNGYVTSVIDGNGLTTTVERDITGQITKISRPDHTEVQMSYNNYRELIRSQDTATGDLQLIKYDEYGAVTEVVKGTGLKTSKIYDTESGLLLSETDPSGVTKTFEYNGLGLVSRVIVPQTAQTTYEKMRSYNSLGQLQTVSDSAGALTSYTYDVAGNVHTETVRHDSGTNLTTEFGYDDFNRNTYVRTPKNELTQMIYSATGKLEKIVDPNNKETVFGYNNLDQVISKTDPLNRTTQMDYDGNGNISHQTTPRGHLFSFVYDGNDKLIQKNTPDNNYQYQYDIRGNMIVAEDSDSKVTFTVDVKGRVVSTTATGKGVLISYPATKTDLIYNADDKRISMSDSFGGNFAYTYFADGKLQRVLNSRGEAYSFLYDVRGRIKSIDRPSIDTIIDYADGNAIASITHSVGGMIKGFANYNRNNAGVVTSRETEEGTSDFGYDANGNLTLSTQPASRLPASEGSYSTESFSYDNIGNRVTSNQGNLIYDVTKSNLLEDALFTYQYDTNGNMYGKVNKLNGEYTKYDYSSENQLIGIKTFISQLSTVATRESTYYYDALGRRIKKSVFDSAHPSDALKTFDRQYVYDADEIAMEFDGNSNLLARYTHSSLRTDDVLAVDITSNGVAQKLAPAQGTYVFLKDQVGTVDSIANGAGAIVQKNSYSGFGVRVGVRDGINNDITGNPVINVSYAFSGKELDSESGLYYFRARYYDPRIGRFIQPDPDPGSLVDPISIINKYAFARNNPGQFADPTGRFFYNLVAIFFYSAISAAIQSSFGEGRFDQIFVQTFFYNTIIFGIGLGAFSAQPAPIANLAQAFNASIYMVASSLAIYVTSKALSVDALKLLAIGAAIYGSYQIARYGFSSTAGQNIGELFWGEPLFVPELGYHLDTEL